MSDFSAHPRVSSSDWQPIETAPMDGTELLLSGPSWNGMKPDEPPYFAVGLWQSGAWREGEDGSRLWSPTHWMPLPEPPVSP